MKQQQTDHRPTHTVTLTYGCWPLRVEEGRGVLGFGFLITAGGYFTERGELISYHIHIYDIPHGCVPSQWFRAVYCIFYVCLLFYLFVIIVFMLAERQLSASFCDFISSDMLFGYLKAICDVFFDCMFVVGMQSSTLIDY